MVATSEWNLMDELTIAAFATSPIPEHRTTLQAGKRKTKVLDVTCIHFENLNVDDNVP